MKLYPPIIEGTIPAFYGQTLTVPFTMNKSVSTSEIKGFELKLKTVQSGYQPFAGSLSSTEWNRETNEVKFILPSNLNIGQFYKIQMAYIDMTGTIGYYSTVGVVKCTSNPEVSILDPKNGNTYEGIYSQKGSTDEEIRDYTEKVYSYIFTLKDVNGNILETSGEKIHDSSKDIFLYESTDSYTVKTNLEQNKIYYLDYSVKTINGLVKSAQTKYISQNGSIDSKLNTKIKCDLDYENGYIDVSLTKPDDVEIEETAVGSFYLLRASDEDNFNSWHEVLKFVLQGQQPSRHLWKDMTVKQGVKYKYAIQQFNTYGLRSNKIESDIIQADFEYAFLYDGDRQLKIKYNPKISSFKSTLLESKVDTIGSKHPFIFRNGNVNYKEFPISGLISYLSDENELFYITSNFLNEKELSRTETINNDYTKVEEFVTESIYLKNKNQYYYKIDSNFLNWIEYIKKEEPEKNPNNYKDIQYILHDIFRDGNLYYKKEIKSIGAVKTTNLTSNNIYLERNFKLDVLDWLNNGKPKLFRSPTEGNYIVRLMNISLSPEDVLGRMIHTFNCTAYEIAENNYNNLEEYNFVKVNVDIQPTLRWLSVDLEKSKIKDNQNLLKFTASSIHLEGLRTGEKLLITTVEGKEEKTYSIMIGATGSYIIDLVNNVKILNLSFLNSESNKEVYHQGTLTYSYYSNEFKDSFDTVNNIKNSMIPCQQFIGEHENIIAEIENTKDKIDSIGFIRFNLRNDNIEVYRFNDKYYSNKEATDEIDLVDLIDIYKVNILDDNKKKIDYEWFDGYNNKSLGKDCAEEYTKININDFEEDIDIKDTTYYELYNVPNIKSIKIGAAIIAEICYVKKTVEYDLEKTNANCISKKEAYDAALKELKKAISNGTTKRTQLKFLQDKAKEAYQEYIKAVDLAIQEAERR